MGFFRVAALPVLGVLGGAIADRYDRGRLLVGVQCLNLAVTLVVGFFLFTDRISLPVIYGASFLMGVGWSIDWPARRSLMMDLVGRDLLHRAVVLDTGTMFLMKIVGPILGGALFRPLGPAGVYGVLAAVYIISIILLLRIHAPAKPVRSSAREILTNLKLGLQYVRRSDVIWPVILITIVMNSLGFPYMFLTPVVARDYLGVGPELLGLLVAGDGIGTLLGAVLQAKLGDRRAGWTYIGGSLSLGVLLVCFALSPWYWVSFACLVLAGIGVSGFATNQTTIILAAVPEEMRGRAMGVVTAAIGSMPLGVLAIGALADATTAPLAIAVLAGLCALAVGIITLRSPALRAH